MNRASKLSEYFRAFFEKMLVTTFVTINLSIKALTQLVKTINFLGETMKRILDYITIIVIIMGIGSMRPVSNEPAYVPLDTGLVLEDYWLVEEK